MTTGRYAGSSTSNYDSGYYSFQTNTLVNGGNYYWNPSGGYNITTIYLRGVTIGGTGASGMGNITSSTRQNSWMKNGTLTQWASGVAKPYTGNTSTTGNGNQGIKISGSGWYNDNYLYGDIRFTGTYTYSWAEDADSVTYS